MAKSILLVGLDVAGQSIGLALKQSGVEAEVVGYDPDGKLATEAKRKGAIDRAENRISAAQRFPVDRPIRGGTTPGGNPQVVGVLAEDGHRGSGCIAAQAAWAGGAG